MSSPLEPDPLLTALGIQGVPREPKDYSKAFDVQKAATQQRLEELQKKDPNRGANAKKLFDRAAAAGDSGRYPEGLELLVEVEELCEYSLKTKKWQEKINLEKCKPGKKLASGSFGAVYSLTSDDPAMPKVVFKVPIIKPKVEPEKQRKAEQDAATELAKEAENYAKAGDHPNIARCLGVRKIGDANGLVMEAFSGGNVHQANKKMRKQLDQGKISHEQYWGTMQYCMASMLQGFAHLEDVGMAQSDVKPENVMINGETGEVKLVDFGGAVEVGKGPGAWTNQYAAPEAGKENNQRVDVFGTGATAYEMGEREVPFAGRDGLNYVGHGLPDASGKPKRLLNQETNPNKTSTMDQGNRSKARGKYAAESDYTDFVTWLTHPDPKKRPSAREALNHPFMKNRLLDDEAARSVIKYMKKSDEELRKEVEELRKQLKEPLRAAMDAKKLETRSNDLKTKLTKAEQLVKVVKGPTSDKATLAEAEQELTGLRQAALAEQKELQGIVRVLEADCEALTQQLQEKYNTRTEKTLESFTQDKASITGFKTALEGYIKLLDAPRSELARNAGGSAKPIGEPAAEAPEVIARAAKKARDMIARAQGGLSKMVKDAEALVEKYKAASTTFQTESTKPHASKEATAEQFKTIKNLKFKALTQTLAIKKIEGDLKRLQPLLRSVGRDPSPEFSEIEKCLQELQSIRVILDQVELPVGSDKGPYPDLAGDKFKKNVGKPERPGAKAYQS